MTLRARLKSLTATPNGLLTLASGRGGIDTSSALAFQGTSMFGFPRSQYLDGFFYSVQNASYGAMYESQPAVRAVVDHLAGHFQQVSCKLYKGRGAQRIEDTTHDAVEILRFPNDYQLGPTLLRDLAVDFLVYDNAYLVKVRNPGGTQPFVLIRIPAYAMGVRGANRLYPDGYRVIYADGSYKEYDPSEVIHWRGTNAIDPRVGWSRMETLRQVLIGEAMRQAADIEFSRGGRIRGGIIQRPIEAPALSDEAARRLEEGFSSRARGMNSGRSPLLEEGMTWIDAGVTPKEAETILSTQLAMGTVCHVFNLHPAVMGVYSNEVNLADGRKQEYQDTLPALMGGLQDALTLGLMVTEFDDRTREFEFDLNEKLEGDPVERMQAATAAVGRPWKTVNEQRAEAGLGKVDGGDELTIPLNLALGKLPAPNVMPPSHAAGGPGAPAASNTPTNADPVAAPKADEIETKAMLARRKAAADRRDEYAAEATKVYRRHYNRQAASLKGKAEVALDTARWNDELAADIKAMRTAQIRREGEIQAARLMGTFDMSRVENYIDAGAKAAAAAVNAATQREVEAQIEDAKMSAKSEAGLAIAAGALAVAASSRADQQGNSDATATAAFAAQEAGRQNPGEHGLRQKVWVWSHLPNSRHGGLSNEHELVGAPFSNGMRFPGDPDAGPEQTVNCKCLLEVI